MAMSEEQLERWINQLIKDDQLYKFYKCKDWRELSEAIKKENNYECVFCKRKGFHTPARSVHHVQWVKKHPRLALSRYYTYKGKQYVNLIPLCESCPDALPRSKIEFFLKGGDLLPAFFVHKMIFFELRCHSLVWVLLIVAAFA